MAEIAIAAGGSVLIVLVGRQWLRRTAEILEDMRHRRLTEHLRWTGTQHRPRIGASRLRRGRRPRGE